MWPKVEWFLPEKSQMCGPFKEFTPRRPIVKLSKFIEI